MTRLQTFARRYRRALHVGLGIAAVGMLLWGRLILKEAPRTATADEEPLATAPAGGERPIKNARPVLDVKAGVLGKKADQTAGQSKSESFGSDDFDQMPVADSAAVEVDLRGVTAGKVPADPHPGPDEPGR